MHRDLGLPVEKVGFRVGGIQGLGYIAFRV